MINLHIRTEYSFHTAFGRIPVVMEAGGDGPLAITDRAGTWGHAAFGKAMGKANRKAIFGTEIAVVSDAGLRERQPPNYVSFIARTNTGLREIYQLITEATDAEHFYYYPRLDYKRLTGVSKDVIILSGANPNLELLKPQKNLLLELNPTSHRSIIQFSKDKKLPLLATSDNYFPRPEHRPVYEIVVGRNRDNRTTAMHILNEWEWLSLYPNHPEAIKLTYKIAEECTATLPKAKMVKYESKKTLEQLCIAAAPARGINLKDKVYKDRLRRELDMIAEKDFADYFFVIWDMLHWAKQHMLVGPARGSSCGSLVCYLLSITEIDPIPYALIFERFIDINRKDLPDVDIDFPEDRRDMVFNYLKEKYGADCVARLGTILRFKAKSTIGTVADALGIPQAEMKDLKGAIIERSTGDARAQFCILDTFEGMEIGRKYVKRYPHLKIAAEIESHAQYSGQHAAGIVITAEPVSNFCSVDSQTGASQVDKYDAEALNLLKIDALGLRTLTVIQDCLDQIGWQREHILKYPVDDQDALELLNQQQYCGVFQFEGYALQSLCRQMKAEHFEDICALTALARPGPLNSGGANEYIRRKNGAPALPLHPLIADITKVTYGIVIYQEQVMQIGRVMGQLSWEDVSSLRKAMSKSLGKEFFDHYWDKFKAGAAAQGISEPEAKKVWDNINTMGSWSFNRSHAVAYGLVSYWCLVLKAHYPLEWAAACLRHPTDDEQCIRILRELTKAGYQYKPFDPVHSSATWAIRDGVLIGGLTNIKGVGIKKAEQIIERRKSKQPLLPGQIKLLTDPQTPYDLEKVFEGSHRFKDLFDHPEANGIATPITLINTIKDSDSGEVLILAKVVHKSLRDQNEISNIEKRGGRVMTGQTQYLNLRVEDDTGPMLVCVGAKDYIRLGRPIVEAGKVGDWYLFKGKLVPGLRMLRVQRTRKM